MIAGGRQSRGGRNRREREDYLPTDVVAYVIGLLGAVVPIIHGECWTVMGLKQMNATSILHLQPALSYPPTSIPRSPRTEEDTHHPGCRSPFLSVYGSSSSALFLYVCSNSPRVPNQGKREENRNVNYGRLVLLPSYTREQPLYFSIY
ncbi:hypothetical protein SAY87_005192 [Trapa incisa]|uniref:Uncharacterized protein n=1 Tax=Trapa incisa TaxID=236973 RepID=A0AAN7K5R1_9MYRT|nr:hypothetical protein SAY87_005192 [Trapa incisa]